VYRLGTVRKLEPEQKTAQAVLKDGKGGKGKKERGNDLRDKKSTDSGTSRWTPGHVVGEERGKR